MAASAQAASTSFPHLIPAQTLSTALSGNAPAAALTLYLPQIGKTGSLSANFNIGKVAENDQSAVVGQLHSSGKVSLASGAEATDAIHLLGTQVSAASVSLDAQNGGILQESAQSTQAHNSWGVTLGAGASIGKTTLADAGEHETPKTQRGINARSTTRTDDGCIEAWVPDGGGGFDTQYFDPDSFELKLD